MLNIFSLSFTKTLFRFLYMPINFLQFFLKFSGYFPETCTFQPIYLFHFLNQILRKSPQCSSPRTFYTFEPLQNRRRRISFLYRPCGRLAIGKVNLFIPPGYLYASITCNKVWLLQSVGREPKHVIKIFVADFVKTTVTFFGVQSNSKNNAKSQAAVENPVIRL